MTYEAERSQHAAETEEVLPSLLDQAIKATKQTERDEAQRLIDLLVRKALDGTVVYSKNLTITLNEAIRRLDEKLSTQVSAILHDPDFLKLEGTWRGLHYLVKNADTTSPIKVKMLNVSKRELSRDLARAVDFDQSEMFRRIYDSEFDTPGGEPYGALIGDYEFGNHPEDIDCLSSMSNIAAASYAPFIASTNAKMFGLEDFRELSKPKDLKNIFGAGEYARWRSFRDSADSAFVVLTMPRVLARTPYGSASKTIDEFAFEEAPKDERGRELALEHNQYCWMNASYVLGARLTDAFAQHGWCTAIRGAETGGKVSDLPTHAFYSDDGDIDQKCPTEIGIGGRREVELSECGFFPLSHYKNTDYAVFFGAQTVRRPKKMDRPAAQSNENISAKLPYVMAVSRFAQYLKIIGRDKIGSFMEVGDCSAWLRRWINNYVNADNNATAETRMRYPLRDAKIEVTTIPGRPGSYHAVAHLRPWLQMEELTASLRLVAEIPQKRD